MPAATVRRIAYAAVIVAAIAAAAAIGAYRYLRSSLVQVNGTVAVQGLSAGVDIVRDEDAITHVFAASRRDSLFGLGYAHAQDRLWQMDRQRRVASGAGARTAWATLPAATKADVDAYVAGINAFIAGHRGLRRPLEFMLRRLQPEPWTGPDVLLSLETMAPDIGGGVPASRGWVVDGTMTASGKPMLAGDSYVRARIPSMWYLAHLSAGDFDVIGATRPGVPAVIMGRTRRIAWTSIQSTTRRGDYAAISTWLHLNDARDRHEFTGALCDYADMARDFLYADVDGHIGYRTAGNSIVREDPADHFIVPAPADSYAGRRIAGVLTSKPRFTVDDFAGLQSDRLSLLARELLPQLLVKAFPDDERDDQALTLLRRWDDITSGDSAAAAIFEAWYYELTGSVTGEDHPVLTAADDVVMRALHSALARLGGQLGPDMSAWRWDGVHHVVFAHETLDGVPLLGRWLRRTVTTGGDASTVNAGPVSAARPFEQPSLAEYRQIIDLSAADDSRFLDALGQSEHVLSPRYSDGLLNWRAGTARKMRATRADAERNAVGRLRLEPLPH